MKYLFSLVLLFCSPIVRSQDTTRFQDTTVVVSFSNFQFLYHGVSNLIQIGFANMDKPYYLTCSCDKITHMDASGEPLPLHSYSVYPDATFRTDIWVYRWVGQDTVLVSKLEFYNVSLPDPILRYGALLPEGTFNPEDNKLWLMQDISSIGEDYHFEILEWKVRIGKKEYSGKGNLLTSEVQSQMRKMKEKSRLEIEARCTADDKQERIVRSFYYKGTNKKIDYDVPPTDENGDFIYEENRK